MLSFISERIQDVKSKITLFSDCVRKLRHREVKTKKARPKTGAEMKSLDS